MQNGCFIQLLPPSARDDGRGRLTINNVKLEDEGDYVCSAVGVHGRFQIEVRLEVDFSERLLLYLTMSGVFLIIFFVFLQPMTVIYHFV